MTSHFDFNLYFPIASDVEHLFMYLLVFHISSLEKYLFSSFAHFLFFVLFLVLLFFFFSSHYKSLCFEKNDPSLLLPKNILSLNTIHLSSVWNN